MYAIWSLQLNSFSILCQLINKIGLKQERQGNVNEEKGRKIKENRGGRRRWRCGGAGRGPEEEDERSCTVNKLEQHHLALLAVMLMRSKVQQDLDGHYRTGRPAASTGH